MMKKEATAMENSIYGSRNPSETLLYSDLLGGGSGHVNQCSMFDNVGNVDEGELGFLEMLGVQEFQIPMGYNRFEEMLEREMLLPSKTEHHQVAAGDGSTVPGTPNSSSISSASNNEGVVVESEHEKAEEEEEDQEGSGKSKKL